MTAYDPFMGSTWQVAQSMERMRANREQLRENTSRLAQSYNSVEVVGVGHIRLPDVVEFFCTFTELPIVSIGITVESELPDNDFPRVSAGVYSWDRDKRGFYTGARVFAVIECDHDPQLQIDFTFTGIAMKDLPDYLLDF